MSKLSLSLLMLSLILTFGCHNHDGLVDVGHVVIDQSVLPPELRLESRP